MTATPGSAGPDPAVLRRLAFIRYLLKVAADQSRQVEPLSGAALLTLHDGLELLLQLIAEQRNVSKRGRAFLEYFDVLDPLFPPGGLGRRVTMTRLNSARVELKHHGTPTSRAAITEFREAVIAFFEENVPRAFGVGLQDVSLAHLVAHTEARAAIMRADAELTANNGEAALREVAIAFTLVLDQQGMEMGPTSPRFFASGVGLDDDGDDRRLAQLLQDLSQQTMNLRHEVNLLRYGIDTRGMLVFRQLAPYVHVMADGSIRTTGRHDVPAAEQVRFCYDFAIASILRIQEQDAVVANLGPVRTWW